MFTDAAHVYWDHRSSMAGWAFAVHWSMDVKVQRHHLSTPVEAARFPSLHWLRWSFPSGGHNHIWLLETPKSGSVSFDAARIGNEVETWWFQTCFIFHNTVGIIIILPIWLSYFSRWFKPPTSVHTVARKGFDPKKNGQPAVAPGPAVLTTVGPGTCPSSAKLVYKPVRNSIDLP